MLLPFSLALVLAAGDPAAGLRSALELEKRGEVAGARQVLVSLVTAHPSWELPRIELARLLLAQEVDLQEARAHVEAARTLAPENPRAQFLHGLVMAELGERELACRSMERALALRHGYDEARFRLAGLYFELHKWPEAEAHYRLYLNNHPAAIGARLQLASVLEHMARLDEAEVELRRLVKAQPKDDGLRLRLADFYQRTGRPELSKKVLGTKSAKRPMRELKKSKR